MDVAPTPAPPVGKPPRFSETSLAIIGAAVIGLVLATVFAGNPFRATRLAFTDYSTPASGAEKASTTRAPATQGPRH